MHNKYFRALPQNRVAQTFFGQKFRYAIKAQVLAGIDRLIYDLNLGSPGRFPDSITWRLSPVKVAVEQQPLPQFKVASDSAYPKSGLLITPYRTAQAAADPTIRLFNFRFCGMRTECTEDIYGQIATYNNPLIISCQACGRRGSLSSNASGVTMTMLWRSSWQQLFSTTCL